jgi:hypothetical protein
VAPPGDDNPRGSQHSPATNGAVRAGGAAAATAQERLQQAGAQQREQEAKQQQKPKVDPRKPRVVGWDGLWVCPCGAQHDPGRGCLKCDTPQPCRRVCACVARSPAGWAEGSGHSGPSIGTITLTASVVIRWYRVVIAPSVSEGWLH